MPELPPPSTTPGEFLERWWPEAFASVELPEQARAVDVRLGVLLHGEGGGEWVFHLREGRVQVTSEPRTDTAFTLVQTVDDWRGALYEGRGGAFGRQASALFRPGEEPPQRGMGGQAPAGPEALARLQSLSGLIQMVVSGDDGRDWVVGFQLGPGEIPAQPTTTVTIAAEDADAMARGELDPMQAFMSGRIQIAGDMALMMQMQMAMAAPPA